MLNEIRASLPGSQAKVASMIMGRQSRHWQISETKLGIIVSTTLGLALCTDSLESLDCVLLINLIIFLTQSLKEI
jgi:hypothetical protein